MSKMDSNHPRHAASSSDLTSSLPFDLWMRGYELKIRRIRHTEDQVVTLNDPWGSLVGIWRNGDGPSLADLLELAARTRDAHAGH